MSRCDFGGMNILPAKITSSQFGWMSTVCQLDCLTGDYTYIHRIMHLSVYRLRYTTGYFHGGPKKYWWQERFPIHEIGRVDGGRGFRTGGNVFRIGRNTFYNRKNKILMQIPEFKRSGIRLIVEFRGIPNGFSDQGTLPWRPASVGLLGFLPKGISLSTFKSLLLVPPSSEAFHLVVAAVSSEIADAATETVVMADVNSATVAELLLVFLPGGPVPWLFLGFLSCQSFAFSAGVNLLYSDVE